MSTPKNSTITITKLDDNIIFESEFKHSETEENISFNMKSLSEIFDNTVLIESVKTDLSFNEDSEKFIISFEGFDEAIELSTNNMLEILVDLYFNNKPILHNENIADRILTISQEEAIASLIRNEKPNKALFFEGRVDLFEGDMLIGVGKCAGLELNNGEYKDMLVISGVVGANNVEEYDFYGDNQPYKVVIYQDNLKITIDSVVIISTDETLDIKHIEFDCDDYKIKAERINPEECPKLNYTDIVCNLNDYDRILDKEYILEDFGTYNSLDKLMEYSMENKKLLPENKTEINYIEDDFFDDLF